MARNPDCPCPVHTYRDAPTATDCPDWCSACNPDADFDPDRVVYVSAAPDGAADDRAAATGHP